MPTPTPTLPSEPQPSPEPKPEPILIPKEVELKYDDGEARDFLSAGAEGGYIIDFLPLGTSFKIKMVRIYGARWGTSRGGNEFDVAIMDKNRKVLHNATYPITEFEVEKPQWVDIEIPNIEVSDKFYVYVYTGTGANAGIHVGADDSVINEHSDRGRGKAQSCFFAKWTYPIDKWFSDKSKVNWMIRVEGIAMVPEK